MAWDHRIKPSFFGGILLQQYDPTEGKLVGPVRNIFRGSDLGFTEGPHLYRRNGWYYLITAEGGTGYDHAVTMARARSIGGPYELHPAAQIITARDRPDAPLQRAGHGNFVETPAGVYHTHLCSRPLPDIRRSPLGREAAIQRLEWRDDDWLWLIDGSSQPELDVAAPDLPAQVQQPKPERTTFDGANLPQAFQWLRSPFSDRLFSLTERPGFLRLYGRESIGSWFEQSLVARRQTSWRYTADPVIEFAPLSYRQMAGLTAYYNRCQFHYLAVTADEAGVRVLTILNCLGDWPQAGSGSRSTRTSRCRPKVRFISASASTAVTFSSGIRSTARRGSRLVRCLMPRCSRMRPAAASTPTSPAASSACAPRI